MLKEGIITPEQLERALRIHGRLEQPRQLGEVLVELGFATKQAIADCIKKHGSGMRLGDMLVEQGLIAPEDLETALRVQQETKAPLGQVLISQGIINERTLLQNLANQEQAPYIEPNFAMIDQAVLRGIAPDFLEKHLFVPFSKSDEGIVTVVVSEFRNETVRHALEDLFQNAYRLALGPEDALRQCIADYRRFRRDGDSTDEHSDADAVVQLVSHILGRAIEERASDIHIEPMEDKIRLRYRIDGVLVYKTDLPKDVQLRVVSRLKILADANITETRKHQGGRISFPYEGVEYDMRLSLYVTVYGECAVLRVLNKQQGIIGVDELGMSSSMLRRYREDVLDMPTGVVLVTGPTGSGKTTTLYSSLAYSNKVDRKIITVEDPVEYTIEGLIQCSTYDKAGRTFASSLREIVRQDPDIIVLGEIRDRETAATAIEAALTGHKVYSTFHTEDTIGGLVRLINMEIEAFLISSTVISVLAQRLLRRICPACATPHQPDPNIVRRLGLDIADLREFEFTRGVGCKQCNQTGYIGRVAVYELLVLNDAVKEAILQKKPAHEIRQISMNTTGLVSMREDAIAKVLRGLTTFDEVMAQTPGTYAMRPLHQVLKLTQ